MARSAWFGARIILRQVSPEASAIFDFIIELHRTCSGNWNSLIGQDVSSEDLQLFLTYAATFLSNVGNYFGSGDQKFIPGVESTALQKMANSSSILTGFETAQSSYYPRNKFKESDAAMVSNVLEQNSIFPENTRLRKADDGSGFEVLIASVEPGDDTQCPLPNGQGSIRLVKGDHSFDLERVCAELKEASRHTANDLQKDILNAYIKSFQTGALDIYRKSQRLWVRDRAPRVENIFGFVEPYRDPQGVRAEFEALVAIADDEETILLAKLVENSAKFIGRLPWATLENDGKGPFEKDLFEPPDFSSIHTLAYCSSIIFPGINVPNFNDIRQEDGFKSVIIANRMVAQSQAKQYPFIEASEAEQFKEHKFPAYYWWVVLHELLGHGTGQMMVEKTAEKFNFDIQHPPINPITGEPITSWYKPGQTWTGQFGDLATTVDKCRAELVGAYLMDDKELLEILGFTKSSNIHANNHSWMP